MQSKKTKINVLFLFLTSVLTFIITMSYYHLWATDINVPIAGYRGDSLAVLLEANNYARGGNVHKMACLGAPDVGGFWANIGDSSVPIPFIRLLWIISGSLEAAVNIHAISNHILLAVCMYLICVKLGSRCLSSMLAGISYSSLTLFVFFANTHLLIYSTCYYIPLFCYIVIVLMKKEENLSLKRIVLISAVMLYTGLNSAYYTFFSMIILVFVGLYCLFFLKSVSKVLTVVLSYVCMGTGIAIYTMPTIIHRVVKSDWLWNSGLYYPVCLVTVLGLVSSIVLIYNKVYPRITIKTIWIFMIFIGLLCSGVYIFIAKYTDFLGTYDGRSVYQVQEMTLSIVNLVMPSVNTMYENLNEQIGFFVDLENCDFSVLGILAGSGFLVSVMYVFRLGIEPQHKDEILQICGKCNCLIMLVAMKGGVSLLIASYITTGIRYYSRMCVFVACFSLIAFAVSLDKLIDLIENSLQNRVMFVFKIIVYGMVIIGLTLSIPTDYIYINTYGNQYGFAEYEQRKKEYDDWQDFMTKIEEHMPQDGMVMELSYLPDSDYYNEELMIHGRQYELGIPAVLSETTIWSYPNKINELVDQDNIEDILIRVAANNFSGIYVDALLYDDSVLDDTLTLLEQYLGKPIVCNEGRRFFFDMSEYTADLRSVDSELEFKK